MVYDKNLKPTTVYDGLKIRGAYSVSQKFLYTISDTLQKGFTVRKYKKDGTKETADIRGLRDPSGLYVYDVNALLAGLV